MEAVRMGGRSGRQVNAEKKLKEEKGEWQAVL